MATHHHHETTSSKEPATDYQTTLFRRLTWEGTVPLEIRADPKELPANSDRGLECYYIQAPRVSYLPLLMQEIRRFLMDVVFDEAAAHVLKEDEWWFESAEGTLLKWYRPTFPHNSPSFPPGIGQSASYMTIIPSLHLYNHPRPTRGPQALPCG